MSFARALAITIAVALTAMLTDAAQRNQEQPSIEKNAPPRFGNGFLPSGLLPSGSMPSSDTTNRCASEENTPPPLLKAEGIPYSVETIRKNPLPFQAAGGTVSPTEHPWIVSQNFLTDLKGASPLMAELVSHRRDMFLTKADPPSYSFGMAWARGAFRAKSEESSWMLFQVRRAYKVWWFQLCDDEKVKWSHHTHEVEELLINDHSWKLYRSGQQVGSGSIE